ncbi:MAG: DUF3147 family protein [Acidobacteriaceae bacterium]
MGWPDFAARFLLGGLITVITGLIAHHFGPSMGGLFLAFPAIFPASATLIEKSQIKKKKAAGLHGARLGAEAAAVDAVGTALGSVGLVGFALFVWQLLENHDSAAILCGATLLWLVLSVAMWRMRKLVHSL